MSSDGQSRIEERENEIHLDLPAAHSESRMARQVLRKFAEVRGMLEREIETLELVASELLGNAVDHGGGGAAMDCSDIVGKVRMRLTLHVQADGWKLSVADEGGASPEDVMELIDPEGMPDLEDERGRGFFLMKTMVEALYVEKSPDGLGLSFIAERKFEAAPED